MRRWVEKTRISGRKPVNKIGASAASSATQASIELADESDIFETEKEEEKRRDSRKVPILFLEDKKEKVSRKTAEPKIAKGANYKLPSVSLLREGARRQKLDEEELKTRARAIEDKCMKFDIEGRVTHINPGPVVTTFDVKPAA